MTVARWRAWYTGGHVYDGESFEDWCYLPDDGVLFVKVFFDAGGSRVASGHDHYWATPEGIYAHSNDSCREIEDRYPGASVKRGKWTTEAEMRRVHDEGMAA